MQPTQTVSASELLGAPVTEIPSKSPAELLPAGVKVREHFPGAGYGRHPVLKRFVSFKDLRPDQIEGTQPKAAPAPSPAQPAMPEPAPAAPSPAPEPIPANPPGAGEKPPDFSDLPPGDAAGGPQSGASEADAATASASHRSVATFVWDTTVQLLAMVLGMEWFPRPVGNGPGQIPFNERQMVIDAFTDYFEWVGMKVLNPLHRLWMALGAYCIPRFFTLVRWFKSRKEKKANATQTSEPTLEPDKKDEPTVEPPGKVHPKTEAVESDFVA